MKPALLVTNLGTPRSPRVEDVGVYLKEFLSDPYVLNIPAPLRWLLVHGFIVPRRSHLSAENYKKIWTERGSPLLFHTSDFVDSLKKRFNEVEVYMAMRYGQPSLRKVLTEIQKAGHRQLWLLPLYPQYAESTVKTTIEHTRKLIKDLRFDVDFKFVDRFFSEEEYLDSLTRSISEKINEFDPDHLLFSYHGLPVSHIKKTDPTGKHCDRWPQCCEKSVSENRNCYRFHCVETTRGVVARLGFSEEKTSNAFQSRLGPARWLEPASDQVIRELARKGVRRLAVVCPSFVSDCLETLEEIGQEGRQIFLDSGGESFCLVPCLNSSSYWVESCFNLMSRRMGLVASR